MIDPVTLAIIDGRLVQLADEMDATLYRSAFNPIIAEALHPYTADLVIATKLGGKRTPDKGWGRTGPSGAGHFVKMVHNGIEYGLMQAYAEGFSIMKAKAPLALDLTQIAEIWRYGSVVRSWLLDLTANALETNPTLEGLEAYVEDSGEGRWTVMEAIDLNISAPVITESLIRRLRSREENNFTDRMISIMRNEFGGHNVKKS